MNTKRIVLLVFLFALTFFKVSAQESAAKNAFTEGDYTTAVKLYQAAIATNNDAAKKANLSTAVKKAQECENLLNQANKAFNQEKYSVARPLYQSILKYNPSDKLAGQRVLLCMEKISGITDTYGYVTFDETLQQKDRKAALKSGSNEDLGEYIKKYPQSNDSELFAFIINSANQIPNSLYLSKYKQAGDMFADAGNKSKAIVWYDKAVVLADTESMYKEALILRERSNNNYKTLLGMAHAGGYQPASEIFEKEVGRNEDATRRMYEYLKVFQTDLYAFLYVYENNLLYYTAELNMYNLNYYAQTHPFFQNPDKSATSNTIYKFAKIIASSSADAETIDKVKRMMEIAASKGNHSAVSWLLQKATLSKEEKKALEIYFEYCAKKAQKYSDTKQYEAYIKYMKGQQLTCIEWYYLDFLSYDLERHERLMANVFGGMDDLDYKYQKEELEGKVWDKDVIDYIKNNAHKYKNDKYSIKIVKKLSNVLTSKNLYDKTKCLTYKMIEAGYYDNVHSYQDPVKKEELFW